MGISFIIQARMGSSRLPNKILLPFYQDKCILELLIDKLKQVPECQIVIATSVSPDNDVIEGFCNNHGIKFFRGSEYDVLQRFIDAAEQFNANKIVRICSDNPFIELNSITQLVRVAQIADEDYISFKINGKPSIMTHFGFWAEYTTLNALKKIVYKTDEPFYHEHVTNYIYTHPEYFSIKWIEGPNCLNNRYDIRMTCDTIEDFKNTQDIYNGLCKDNPYPEIDDIVKYLDMHKEYLGKMVEQIKCNEK